jgi:hypothetical protein
VAAANVHDHHRLAPRGAGENVPVLALHDGQVIADSENIIA